MFLYSVEKAHCWSWCVPGQELEAAHAESKATYDAAVGSLEGLVSKLSNQVADLQRGVDEASSHLDKTRSRVHELEGHLLRVQAVGPEEVKRR